MVYLREGKLQQGEMSPADREAAVGFRGWIKVEAQDGDKTADGHPVFLAEEERYHLVVSAGCPFSHRATVLRALKGLEGAVSVGYTLPARDPEHGFLFPAPGVRDERYIEVTEDLSGEGFRYVHEFYTASPGSVTTAASVPVLWDRRTKRIVSNDSGDIATMFATEFEPFVSGVRAPDYYPAELRSEIDRFCADLNKRVSGGAYRAGFQQTQDAYEKECRSVFDALQELDERLASRRYLIENLQGGCPAPTLADWRLFTTLARFDPVYYSRFKLNLRYLRGFPNLQAHFEDLYSDPRIAATTMFRSIKDGYYHGQVGPLSPEEVVPRGATPFAVRAPVVRRLLGLPGASGKEDQKADNGAAVKGAFVRPESAHRNWITADGSSGLKAESGRYHLFIANNCPWCHRTTLTRAILGLQQAVSMDVLYYRRDPDFGWRFDSREEGCTEDTAAGGITFIRDLYKWEGSAEKSVPVLWDKREQKIVSNESADIIRMFATEFGEFHQPGAPVLFPAALAQEIEEINAWVYDDVANGAYKAGFAKSQVAYDMAYSNFFRALDRVEVMLSKSRFLCGDVLTEADVRLFPPVFRFDNVYHLRFRLNEALISESYPHLQRWLEEVYAMPGVAEASNIRHCKLGYFGRTGNNIIPLGPELAFKFNQ